MPPNAEPQLTSDSPAAATENQEFHNPEIASKDATEVRFSIRAVLIVTALLAVCLSALGAFIRHFPADVQPRLVVLWGTLAAFLIGLVAYHARRRYVAEQQAGACYFRLSPTAISFRGRPILPDYAAVDSCLPLRRCFVSDTALQSPWHRRVNFSYQSSLISFTGWSGLGRGSPVFGGDESESLSTV